MFSLYQKSTIIFFCLPMWRYVSWPYGRGGICFLAFGVEEECTVDCWLKVKSLVGKKWLASSGFFITLRRRKNGCGLNVAHLLR
jgi:hypothetical protein